MFSNKPEIVEDFVRNTKTKLSTNFNRNVSLTSEIWFSWRLQFQFNYLSSVFTVQVFIRYDVFRLRHCCSLRRRSLASSIFPGSFPYKIWGFASIFTQYGLGLASIWVTSYRCQVLNRRLDRVWVRTLKFRSLLLFRLPFSSDQRTSCQDSCRSNARWRHLKMIHCCVNSLNTQLCDITDANCLDVRNIDPGKARLRWFC